MLQRTTNFHTSSTHNTWHALTSWFIEDNFYFFTMAKLTSDKKYTTHVYFACKYVFYCLFVLVLKPPWLDWVGDIWLDISRQSQHFTTAKQVRRVRGASRSRLSADVNTTGLWAWGWKSNSVDVWDECTTMCGCVLQYKNYTRVRLWERSIKVENREHWELDPGKGNVLFQVNRHFLHKRSTSGELLLVFNAIWIKRHLY